MSEDKMFFNKMTCCQKFHSSFSKIVSTTEYIETKMLCVFFCGCTFFGHWHCHQHRYHLLHLSAYSRQNIVGRMSENEMSTAEMMCCLTSSHHFLKNVLTTEKIKLKLSLIGCVYFFAEACLFRH